MVSVYKKNYSHDLIKKSSIFAVNYLKDGQQNLAIHFGKQSGRSMDKFLKVSYFMDQTGAPIDPQAGNIPGGKRLTLRGVDFNDGLAAAFTADNGAWEVKQGRFEVSPSDVDDTMSIGRHRFNTGDDLSDLFYALKTVLKTYPTMQDLFCESYRPEDANVIPALTQFVHSLLKIHSQRSGSQPSTGLKYLLADPAKSSPCKRLNLFLRWVVRDDAVDLGLWRSDHWRSGHRSCKIGSGLCP